MILTDLACQALILHFPGVSLPEPLDFKNCLEKGMCKGSQCSLSQLAAKRRLSCPVERAILRLALGVSSEGRPAFFWRPGPGVRGHSWGWSPFQGCPCYGGGLGS